MCRKEHGGTGAAVAASTAKTPTTTARSAATAAATETERKGSSSSSSSCLTSFHLLLPFSLLLLLLPPPKYFFVQCVNVGDREDFSNSVYSVGVQVDNFYYVEGSANEQAVTADADLIVYSPPPPPPPSRAAPPLTTAPPPPPSHPLITAPGGPHSPRRPPSSLYSHSDPTLRVLNLNTWGLNWPWSRDRSYRYKALAEIITLSDYDLILLQEVWFRSDYEVLRNSVPFVAQFESYNLWCKWLYFPIYCSGLTILSRHPIVDQDFLPFSRRGSFWNFDGEIFANKGVARARVLWNGFSVDVFTTHMVSYSTNSNSDNSHYRYLQSREALGYVAMSDADIKIFGGDLNSLPHKGPTQPYGVFTTYLKDSLTDKYPDSSFDPWFATFGNTRNTYSGRYLEERIDYLFFWSRPGVQMCTRGFSMPSFMTHNGDGRLVSLSDHSALDVEFVVRRLYNDDSGNFIGGDHDVAVNVIYDNGVDGHDAAAASEPPFRPVMPAMHHSHNGTALAGSHYQQQQQQHQHQQLRHRRLLRPLLGKTISRLTNRIRKRKKSTPLFRRFRPQL